MNGTIIADEKGFVIESLYTMDSEPTMLVSRWRVHTMNGHPQTERAFVRYDCGVWRGLGFEASTDNRPAESTEKLPIKAPRGKKVWRDGEWRTK